MAKDPICGMDGKIKAHGHYFCSKGCVKEYENRPSPAKKIGRKPLFKLLGYITAAIAMTGLAAALHFSGYMIQFMGGFFVVVSLLKVMDWKGFAKVFATYDLIAEKSRLYAFTYPLIELALGIAYLLKFHVPVAATVTVVIMVVSSAGVARSLIRKNQVRCACLGTKLRLPLTRLTVFEDLLMATMALVVLFTYWQ